MVGAIIIETALGLAIVLGVMTRFSAVVGFAVLTFIFVKWLGSGAGALAETKLGLLAATLVIVGLQIFFSSFLLSILGLRRNE